MRKEKLLVALSGGVDSAVAAALLIDAGFDVSGAYMKNWINEPGIVGDCPWQQDIDDARAVAQTLGIPFQVVNFIGEYRRKIVEYLIEGYRDGTTPNPDVMCNREIKFGVFMNKALEMGFDRIATGHYAQIVRADGFPPSLWEGADKNKDQSYFLALLRGDQLARSEFPIGGMTKPEVRQKALALGLPNATKRDSQGICFIGKVKMADFLQAHVPDSPGWILDTRGRRIGRHRGLHLHTLGQRRGIGVASPVPNRAYVVVEKRRASNELILALDDEAGILLACRKCLVGNLSFPAAPPRFPLRCLVRPRYRSPASPASVSPVSPGVVLVEFDVPQRAVTPGQIAAFYQGEMLLAGGTFLSVEYPAA